MDNNPHDLFKGILLLSDLDGTLLDSKKEIPKRNLDAIKHFTDRGGLFTVSTGRCPLSARDIALKSGVNCPAVTLNGAMVYDYIKSRAVVGFNLPDNFKAILQSVYQNFPEVGIQVYVESDIFVLRTNDVIDLFFVIEKLPLRETAFEVLPKKINKILLGGRHDLLMQVQTFLSKLGMDGMYGMFTDPTYYEILPSNANKGTAALKVIDICKIKPGNAAAIGDYYNDIDLLKTVDYPIAPDNAPPEIKKYARFIAGHCDDGAVADAVRHIEEILSIRRTLS